MIRTSMVMTPSATAKRLGELFQAVWPDALRYATSLCRRTPGVDPLDLCQEAAVVICEKYSWLTHTSDFTPILITTIRNRHHGIRRNHGRHGHIWERCTAHELELRGASAAFESALEWLMQLRHALSRMTPLDRRAWLMTMRGMAVEEMCVVEGCKRDCMNKRLMRMRRRLREELREAATLPLLTPREMRPMERDVLDMLAELQGGLLSFPAAVA